MIKLLALDLDGTLLNDQKQVSALTVEALRQASQCGIMIALCSGRCHADALYIAKWLDLPIWSVTTNGAYLGHSSAGTLWTYPLSAEKTARVIGLSYTFQAAPCVYTPLTEYNDAGFTRIEQKCMQLGQAQLRNPDKQEVEVTDPSAWQGILAQENSRIMKCISFLPDSARFPAFRAALEVEGGLAITTSIMFGGLVTSVEINRVDVSKGRTLTCLQQHLGIKPEQTLCFGDSENDLSMLSNGYFIAMANAEPKIRSQAWAVTGSNNDDGIAEALKRFLPAL